MPTTRLVLMTGNSMLTASPLKQRGLSQANEFVVESLLEPVVLIHDAIDLRVVVDDRSGGQDGAEIQAS